MHRPSGDPSDRSLFFLIRIVHIVIVGSFCYLNLYYCLYYCFLLLLILSHRLPIAPQRKAGFLTKGRLPIAPQRKADFLALKQRRCSQVILTPSGNSFEQEPQLADSLPLTLATWLTTNYPHLFIVTETANESCIKYIDERSDDHTDSVDTTSPAMEEALFYSSKLVAAGRITSVSSIVRRCLSLRFLCHPTKD